MKVILTTGYCNPPLKRIFTCNEVCYFENKHKLSMYNEKGKVIAWVITDEWQEVVIVYDDGHEKVIKEV